MRSQSTDPYRKHGIDRTHDRQNTYGVHDSYYGNGNYPPDWNARREAVWERQRYQCGRCGTYKGDVAISEVHHVVHLDQGGSNALENLVGLCGDCHALMHPDLDVLNGSLREAAVFPDDDADDRVAVVREPRGDDELRFYVERLARISSPDRNANAVTEASIPTSADTARRAGRSLQRLLLDNGYVPRTTAYHRIGVEPKPTGLLSAITTEGTEVSAQGDGDAVEVDDDGDGAEVYLSADASASRPRIQDPAGESRTERVALSDDDGARIRIEQPIAAPPLSAATAPGYAVGGLRYFGWEPAKLGIVPGILLAVLAPSAIPLGGSIVGIAAVVFLLGLLLRSPAIYRDVAGEPSERVVDERAE